MKRWLAVLLLLLLIFSGCTEAGRTGNSLPAGQQEKKVKVEGEEDKNLSLAQKWQKHWEEKRKGWSYTAGDLAVPILMYHKVDRLPPGNKDFNPQAVVSPENFEKHLLYLKQQGYETITLTDLYAYVTRGEPLPEKPVVLTFDDGYVDFYTIVYPLLKKYDMRATLFVLTGAVDQNPNFLTWKQLEELRDYGIEIGAHTVTHPDLTAISSEEVEKELLTSKRELETRLGIKVDFFAYPTGYHNSQVVTQVQEAGFKGAVLMTPPAKVRRDHNPFLWPRIYVGDEDEKGLSRRLAVR